MQSLTVRLDKQSVLNFTGELLADVVALNHDERFISFSVTNL